MADLSNSSVSISQLARREKMVSAIEAGFPFQLRHCLKYNDRSAPNIEAAYVKKVYDRRPLMNSLRGAIKLNVLKYNQINDRSAPKIDPSAHIQYVERKAFLDHVLIGAHNFYERLLTAASFAQAKAGQLYDKGVSTASGVSVAAKETAQTAQVKAEGLLASSKDFANDIIEASKDTAHAAQVRATDLIETGQEKLSGAADKAAELKDDVKEKAAAKAAELKGDVKEKAAAVRSSASRKVAQVRYTWNDLYLSGKEKLLSRQSQENNSDAHRQLIVDISANRQTLLTHVQSSDINDRSKPFIPAARGSISRVVDNRNRVMSEITHKATLRSLHHVSTRDCSKPAIADVKAIKQNDHKALLAEVQADHQLTHPSAVSDRSAPAIPEGSLDLAKKVREAVLKEVEKGVELSQNKLVMDRSAPQLPSM